MVGPEEDWDEGKPYYARGVHREPNIPVMSMQWSLTNQLWILFLSIK